MIGAHVATLSYLRYMTNHFRRKSSPTLPALMAQCFKWRSNVSSAASVFLVYQCLDSNSHAGYHKGLSISMSLITSAVSALASSGAKDVFSPHWHNRPSLSLRHWGLCVAFNSMVNVFNSMVLVFNSIGNTFNSIVIASSDTTYGTGAAYCKL